ncbi:hypothetical protein Plhal304r1_c052g0136621 [Plasmopara halstedii]
MGGARRAITSDRGGLNQERDQDCISHAPIAHKIEIKINTNSLMKTCCVYSEHTNRRFIGCKLNT